MTMNNNQDVVIPEEVIYDGELLSAKQMKNYLGCYPNKNCKTCYGRGWTGKHLEYKDGEVVKRTHILCTCIKYDRRALFCGIRW